MNTVELFRDLPSDAPISTSAAFRITHGLSALSNNGDRQEMRLTLGQRRTGDGWAVASAGQPTVTCSGGRLTYYLNVRLGIDILHGSGGAVTNIGSINRSLPDAFFMLLDEYRRGAPPPRLVTRYMPRFGRRRGMLSVRLDARHVRPRLMDRGGRVQKWKVSLGYDIAIYAAFTEEQVGRGNRRTYISRIEAGLHFFVEQPRL